MLFFYALQTAHLLFDKIPRLASGAGVCSTWQCSNGWPYTSHENTDGLLTWRLRKGLEGTLPLESSTESLLREIIRKTEKNSDLLLRLGTQTQEGKTRWLHKRQWAWRGAARPSKGWGDRDKTMRSNSLLRSNTTDRWIWNKLAELKWIGEGKEGIWGHQLSHDF